MKNQKILHQLILASQSPRRREILTWTGIPFLATSTDINEDPRDAELPKNLAARLAQSKARAVSTNANAVWVLAADTVVALGDIALGKPRNEEEARTMLYQLRNSDHEVHTSITLRDPKTGEEARRSVTTRVWMRPYTEAEIETYIATGDPFDKAGGYAVQHNGFHPVKKLDCCYANVVGLPLCAVIAQLRDWGYTLPIDVLALCAEHFGYRCPAIDEGITL